MSAAAENSGMSVAGENCCTAQLLNILFNCQLHCVASFVLQVEKSR